MSLDILGAVRNEDLAAIRSCCTDRFALSQHDEEGRTPLIIAAAEGKLESVKALLDLGADVQAVDVGGRNAFLAASGEGHCPIIDFLSSYDPSLLHSVTKSGNTGLHRAAAYGHPAAVSLLSHKGVRLDLQNSAGETALIRASRWGHDDCVAALLNAGARPETSDSTGRSAVDWAVVKGHDEVAALLRANNRNGSFDAVPAGTATASVGPLPNLGESGDGCQQDSYYIDGTADGALEADAADTEQYELGLPMHVEGLMAKQGHFFKTWKNRWFVLEGRTMSYYAKEGAKSARGVISMVDGTDVIVEEKYPRPYCFTVITPTKKFILQTANEDEMAEWIEAIQNNLECCAPPGTPAGGLGDDDD